MPLSMAEFLSRLDGVVQRGDYWMARCPAHEDTRQSLSVRIGRTQPILLRCHAGCDRDAILRARGLTLADISAPSRPRGRPPGPRPGPGAIIAEYDYRGVDGVLRYQALRYDPKDFRQRRPDPERPGEWVWNMDGVEKVPYRLDEIAAFCRMGRSSVVVTEGEKDADALWDQGVPATTNVGGAGKWTASLSVMLHAVGVLEVLAVPDNDEPGRAHAATVITHSRAVGMVARLVPLDGLDDHGDTFDFLAQYGIHAFHAAIEAARRYTPLTAVHEVFVRWLGPEYDLQVLDVILAASAAHWLDGEPCWAMIVSGAGAAKTETVQAIEGAGGVVISTLSSVAALLSGSPRRERTADSTGGLLPSLGDQGVLIIKDMTSILALPSTSRGELLAAFRELHDGRWSRQVGTEGGRRLEWAGRLTVVAACTSAWDKAHEAIAAMGDRFLLVRFDSEHGRRAAFMQAQQNNGHERQMRQELAQAVGRALSAVDRDKVQPLNDEDSTRLYELANLVTLARTAVDTDYRDDVRTAYAPEMPTRYGKQLCQLVRGGMALGLERPEAINLAVRCAQDSIPPLRWRILQDVTIHPESRVSDIRRRMNTPYNTIKRTLDALLVLNIVISHGEDQEMTYTVKTEITTGISIVSRDASEPWRHW